MHDAVEAGLRDEKLRGLFDEIEWMTIEGPKWVDDLDEARRGAFTARFRQKAPDSDFGISAMLPVEVEWRESSDGAIALGSVELDTSFYDRMRA